VRRQGLWVVVGQVFVALGGALICYLTRSPLASLSALIGGGIGAAATLAQVLVGSRGASAALVRGSVVKLVVTAVLLVVVLRNWRVAPGPLFATYLLTFVVYWLGLARTYRKGP